MPDDCAMALKEWAAVCQALAVGRQTILLRKGGIAEGPGGFRAEHDAFWLLPTYFHEAPRRCGPTIARFSSGQPPPRPPIECGSSYSPAWPRSSS